MRALSAALLLTTILVTSACTGESRSASGKPPDGDPSGMGGNHGDSSGNDDGSTPSNPVAPPATPPIPVDLSDLLATATAKNKGRGGGVLRVATAGGVIFEGAAGKIDVSASSSAMTKDTPFEIASVSKTFTAALLLLLVEDHKLALDDALSTVLGPDVTDGLLKINGTQRAGTITFRQLLAHTSGLPDYWMDGPLDGNEDNAFLRAFNADVNRFWQPLEILPFARQLTPIHAPGGAWHYGDTSYVLLGLAIEKLEGNKPLSDIYRSRIYTPLGMTSTYLAYREQPPAGAAGATISHRYEGNRDLHGRVNQTADWAGGGLVSTTKDLERFILGIAEPGKLFKSPATLASMRQLVPAEEQDVSYGLGIFETIIGNGGTTFGHDGHGNAFMYYWVERKIAFTGTLNQLEGQDFFPMIDEAAKRIDLKYGGGPPP